MKDVSWIEKASRKNFLRYLSAACDDFSLEERAGLVPLFQSWAGRVGAEDLLKSFADGQSIRPSISFVERGKGLIRPFAKKLIAGLR
jgi:hypothetical protein